MFRKSNASDSSDFFQKMAVFFILIAVAAGIIIYFNWKRSSEEDTAATNTEKEETTTVQNEKTSDNRDVLSAPEDFLPQNLVTGKTPPEAEFVNRAGEKISMQDLPQTESGNVWLLFWASWCPDCEQQFEILSQMEKLAADKEVSLVLVDRLNPDRESVEKAEKKLSEYDSEAFCVFDEDEKVYQAWGMKEIPGSVVLGKNGEVKGFASGTLTIGECQGLLEGSMEGKDKVLLNFLMKQMSGGDGGIYSCSADNGDSPSGKDVLSESEGLLLKYALDVQDKELFDLTWNYVRDHLAVNGLAAWYVSEDNKKAAVNATLDDLRICDALIRAGSIWDGAYQKEAEEMLSAIQEKCLDKDGNLVNYCDLKSGEQADSISLCYLAPSMLLTLAEKEPAFSVTADSAEKILINGRISDDFPLYYAGYNYTEKSYIKEDLNISEALYTLLHLAQADLLPEESWQWVKERVTLGDLGARYDISGNVIKGYHYHSTAAYGLCAWIALEKNDDEVFELALRRMERKRILDADDSEYGAFLQKGSPYYAFDQLIPLVVYSESNNN